ncbi:choice-of-anchor A family protein [Streptomyces sp. NPDC091268]|uniref:choice-of-anchor A family protein n=1 Tax=Streptomyces sp. NPDC091268 TaxID=3365979 RepID=UPI003822CED2
MSLSVRASCASAATTGGSRAVGVRGGLGVRGVLGAVTLGVAVAVAPPAAAAPAPQTAVCAVTLGLAGRYGEFVEGDGRHTPDAEGAVAIGGNADFRGGFSVGQELSTAQADALPGGNALVVAGDLTGDVRVVNGNGIYGGTLTGLAEAHNGKVAKGPSPIDFAAEFRTLRATSKALAAAQSPSAQWSLDGSALQLTGTDRQFNAFMLAATDLEKAKEIRIKVPVGAVTVVNVMGAAYDQNKAETTGFFLWDEAGRREMLDDKPNSAADEDIRARLLWNFPDAVKVTKKSGNAWPGTILAPGAALDLGDGGPVNGSVIAKSLTGKGGAQTRHRPFTGCLQAPPAPADGAPSPAASLPAGTAASTPAGRPGAPGGAVTPPTARPGTSGGSASPSPTSSAPAAVTGRGSGGIGGGLALTGAGRALPLAIGGAFVLAAGTGMVLVARRRRA